MAKQDAAGGGGTHRALYGRSMQDLENQIQLRAKAGWIPIGQPYKIDDEFCQLIKPKDSPSIDQLQGMIDDNKADLVRLRRNMARLRAEANKPFKKPTRKPKK
jgi:hypothetical protein